LELEKDSEQEQELGREQVRVQEQELVLERVQRHHQLLLVIQ
jgi:hypothetical protein